MSIAARAIHGVNVCIIPHPDNDDQPLLLRPWPLRVMAALLLVAKLAAVTMVTLSPTYAELSTITVDRVVQLTNVERTKAGLDPLTVNSQLSLAAKDKAAHMLAEDYFAHISPSGVTPWFWMSKHGYTYKVAGENLAIDFLEAEEVVAAWLASPTHKDNMLHAAYVETGVAVVAGEFQGATSTIVVHMFGLPPGAQAAVPPPKEIPPTATSLPAVATPVPTPVATPLPAPITPPRMPRIALQQPDAPVTREVALRIEGEANSAVIIAVNETPLVTLLLDSNQAQANLDLSAFSDGPLRLTAVAQVAGQQSEVVSLLIMKDSTGPELKSEELSFMVAPLFDRGEVYVRLPADKERVVWDVNGERISSKGTVVAAEEPLHVAAADAAGNATTLNDILLLPQFETSSEDTAMFVPRRAVQLSNKFIGTVLMIITFSLVLTVLIRIQIQRPHLLGHAMMVILLAGTLLWL